MPFFTINPKIIMYLAITITDVTKLDVVLTLVGQVSIH